MNKFATVIFLVFSVMVVCMSCDKEDDALSGIEGLTLENFPKLDGSTSNDPLMRIISYKLLGYRHEWIDWRFRTVHCEEFPSIYSIVSTSQTHNSIINLLDGMADVVFSARTMSPDEKQYADSAGVMLIATPIALDAFIFGKCKKSYYLADARPSSRHLHRAIQALERSWR